MAARRSPKRAGGRPSLFRAEYVRLAQVACAQLGATDADLAALFEVDRDTINEWKRAHPEFSVAVKAGKAETDARVVQSLFRRAMGYSHKAQKIFYNSQSDTTRAVDYVQRYPPDTTACIFWLKNRQPDLWRDRHEVAASASLEAILAASWETAHEPGQAADGAA